MNHTHFFYRSLFIIAASAAAASAGTIKFGKYAGEFMAIGVGGRSLGLGSSYVAVASDVTAGYWNPAGLALIKYPELTLMHDERYGNLMNYDYAAAALPSGANDSAGNYHASSFGISVIRLGIDDIPDTRGSWNDINGNGLFDDGPDIRPDINQITYFNAVDYAVYATYARQRSEDFFYGVNIKFIRRSVGDFSAMGIGFDIGCLYTPYENFSLGAMAQDVTTTLVAWSTGTNELIAPTLKFGAAYGIDLLGGRILPVVDADIRFEGRKFAAMTHAGPVSVDLHGGLEFDYKKSVAIRGGVNDLGNMTVGIGIHLRKLDIDYSFSKFDGDAQLGNSHRISLKLTIEEERFRRGGE